MNGSRSYAWLWLVVALQVAIPASYYLRGSEPDDERFAWRMFSGVRLKRCQVTLREYPRSGAQPAVLGLAGVLHGSWIHAIERGRLRVIERFLTSRCVADIERVQLERRCRGVSGAVESERYAYACRQRGSIQITRSPERAP